jgi:hypothetical protein
MLIKYTINKRMVTDSEGKYLNIPIGLEFLSIDQTEDIEDVTLKERDKAINETFRNKIFDAETVRYTFPELTVNNNKGLLIKFRFWNKNNSTYSDSYQNSGITDSDIRVNSNGFKKSFFRLNFYDSNSGETNTVLFTEDVNVYKTEKPILTFNELYWLRTDDFFTQNNFNRVFYMDAKFFNAKTGKIHNFINTPVNITTPINISQYSDPNNRGWRTCPVELVNPRFNNSEYNFRPTAGVGGNTPTMITMTEFIMI